MRERAALLGLTGPEAVASETLRVDAAVLKINRQSARVRVSGESGPRTFRPQDVGTVVPGHSVTLDIEKRWTWKGDDYVSGRIENPHIAMELGLLPLPLCGGELVDLRSTSEPYRRPDPYAPLWRKLTQSRAPGSEWTRSHGNDSQEQATAPTHASF